MWGPVLWQLLLLLLLPPTHSRHHMALLAPASVVQFTTPAGFTPKLAVAYSRTPFAMNFLP